MTSPVPVVVLGAGPAGLGAALRLSKRGFKVTVLERSGLPGGNSGSFEFEGFQVDYGSHRLHPSCAPAILADIRAMLGDDLLDRPRHGRIRLQNRWLHFPLKPLDLISHAPPAFVAGAAMDALRKRAAPADPKSESFASILQRGLGPTICREFYFPYARKIWGVEPDRLDAEQARRRVSASSPGKLISKIVSSLPVVGKGKGARFFYPRQGFGQISHAYKAAAEAAGAKVLLNTPVENIQHEGAGRLVVSAGGQQIETALVVSTIPITLLIGMMDPAAPATVLAAANSLRYRSMLLIYLILETDSFTEFDAHYFPSADIAITRLSEPKHYGLANVPGRTVLCAELPCSPADPYWNATNEDLSRLVEDALKSCGLPIRARIQAVTTRRIPQAYPIYEAGFTPHFELLDEWLSAQPGVLSIGRQGLFAHDNTHHTLAMAYAAAECLDENAKLDRERWAAHRREFEAFVVED